MSSLFTYNHSPPKPASPWSGSPVPATSIPPTDDPSIILDDIPGHLRASLNSGRIRNAYLPTHTNPLTDDSGNTISTLSSEPQTGSTEYKLSLSRGGKSEARLEQLTTQLLWRLQQSTSYHGTNTYSGTGSRSPGHLMESKGALYEIGVADDGTLVGLDEAEMEDSLEILRTMAGKLGAAVEILRRVYVRSVTQEDIDVAEKKLQDHIKAKLRARGKNHPRSAKKLKERDEAPDLDRHEAEKFKIPALGTELWVVEALVKPGDVAGMVRTPSAGMETPGAEEVELRAEELRVSLTGPTTGGKSSLLGMLTSGELDNGRGKARLSMLRHRHEINTGVTSSVTWELFGFRPALNVPPPDEDSDDGGFFGAADPPDTPTEETAAERLINYATPNVSSWTDIHSSTTPSGRLIFISDSAGHLKYRRTALRSIIGWAPHYVVLCIPATAKELEADTLRRIEICIKLNLRLIVVFTKIDIAGKDNLRIIFGGVLNKLKTNNRRRPVVLSSITAVKDVVAEIETHETPEHIVPVIFTSSVRGDGGDFLRELLMRLPIPPPPTPTESSPSPLFHVEEKFTFPSEDHSNGIILSGTLKYGTISLNSILTVGPFVSTSTSSPPPTTSSIHLAPPPPHPEPCGSTSSSGGGTTSDSASATDLDSARSRRRRRRRKSPHAAVEERVLATPVWRRVKVISIRHLRLPVTRLLTGEAGTIGIIPADDVEAEFQPPPKIITSGVEDISTDINTNTPPPLPVLSEIRKAHVLLPHPLPIDLKTSADSFAVELELGDGGEAELAQGMEVAVWSASLKASMRVVGIWRIMGGKGKVVVRMQWVKRGVVEYVEGGERVLVMDNGGGGRGGKGIWVGRIVEEAG